MAEERARRRLSTILAADVVGYSALMEADEEAGLQTLKGHRSVIDRLIAYHEGRVFSTAGDSIMADFPSAVEAVRAAIAIQEELATLNTGIPEGNRMTFRIGINLGDVMVEGDDLFGDGVNVAARIEGLCAPGEVFVSASVHGQVEGKLSLGFEDEGEHKVKNIARPVRVYRVRTNSREDKEGDATTGSLPLPDKPSIAVLPFNNMSNDPDQEHFSDGITEDIITELSKISGLFVIARHSSFTYKEKPVTVKQVGRELGVRYVLEGSVRKAGSRLRITAQLIDAPTDHHVWVDRFDRELKDIFAVQDEVARKVAEELKVTLSPVESRMLAQTPTDNLEAYDLYKRGRRMAFPPTRHNIRSAENTFERVIAMDPTFAGGYAWKSMMISRTVIFNYSDDRQNASTRALELARRAVELDPELPESHSALGFAYCASGLLEEAVAAARHAVELQPGDAFAHFSYSRCLREAGRYDEAFSEGSTAVRLDPKFVEGPYLNALARTAFLVGRFQDAVDAFEHNSMQGGPSYLGQMIFRAAACSFAGQIEKARELVREMLRERSDLCIGNFSDVRGDLSELELEKLREGLRMAGLPD